MSRQNIKPTSDSTAQHRVAVMGSDLEANLPSDLTLYFRGDILVDRCYGAPSEMDAYYLYLALKSLEKPCGANYLTERRMLVDAVTKRMQQCGGFWSHGVWTGSDNEIHMRYTSAAIRLWVEALSDGLFINSSTIVDALRTHLSYSEPLSVGIWFLHDSFEKYGTQLAGWEQPMRNGAWGSSPTNGLVLNTHIDTLVTVMQVLRRVEINEVERLFLLAKFESGVSALKTVLSAKQRRLWRYFADFDSAMRAVLFAAYSFQSITGRLVAAIIKGTVILGYCRVRQWFRSSFLFGYVFPDGYLERDISLSGRGFNYHIINLWDLAKFVLQARETGLVTDSDFLRTCEVLIDRGIDYATRSSYWCFTVAKMKRGAGAIVLCEAILARLATKANGAVPQHWITAYCTIRRTLSPSPAILGYDPLVVSELEPHTVLTEFQDTIRLRDGRTLIVDLMREKFTIKGPAPHAAVAVSEKCVN